MKKFLSAVVMVVAGVAFVVMVNRNPNAVTDTISTAKEIAGTEAQYSGPEEVTTNEVIIQIEDYLPEDFVNEAKEYTVKQINTDSTFINNKTFVMGEIGHKSYSNGENDSDGYSYVIYYYDLDGVIMYVNADSYDEYSIGEPVIAWGLLGPNNGDMVDLDCYGMKEIIMK